MTHFDRDHDVRSLVDTLGGPEVTHAFVHCTRSLPYFETLGTVLPGFHRYAERALVAARPHDVVCVAHPVEEPYLAFLGAMGIGPRPENVVVVSEEPGADEDRPLWDLVLRSDRAVEKIAALVSGSRSVVLNPYIASATAGDLATRLGCALGRAVNVLGGTPTAVERADSKHHVRAKAVELGVPVAPGEIVALARRGNGRSDPEPLRAALGRRIGGTGRAIVRGTHGTSGSSTFVVDDGPASLENACDAIRERTDNDVYVVEVMLDVAVSPNIQMYLDPEGDGLSCVGITDQRLVAAVTHTGNIYPSTAATIPLMIRDAYTLSKWLRREGCTGLVGFDFGEYAVGDQHRHVLIEINPRVNAATYPMFLMDHLNRGQATDGKPGIEAFVLATVKTAARSFAELEKRYGHLFFNRETAKGLVPFNIGCLKYGKFSAAIFGPSRDEVLRLHAEVEG